LTAGADDFVTKPFDADELRARLEVGRRFVELNRKLADSQHLLEILATTDTLTGVANGRAVISRLEEELERAERDGSSLSVGMIDIDHFKRVNDTHGHPTGDAVLREFARCVATSLRPYDTLGRVGGDEFLIVMPAAARIEASAVLERVHSAVEDLPVIVDGRLLAITVSLGGATWEGEAADGLIKRADDAAYEAKAQGRNRVVMACDGRDETALIELQQAA
jgi:diguanylate cyclase (GGDEF)-like protein